MLSLARLGQRQGKRIEAHQLLNASNEIAVSVACCWVAACVLRRRVYGVAAELTWKHLAEVYGWFTEVLTPLTSKRPRR